MTKIILLDIDGVLVHPGGYRAALRATFDHFVRLTGLPRIEISEDKLSELERRGITSEWDMTPLLLASLWNEILARGPIADLPDDPSSAAVEIGRYLNGYRPGELTIPEFELVPGQYPSETALEIGCFPLIPIELRRRLLHRSRDVHYSQVTHLFQHFTLGSRHFSETYNLPAEIDTESLLLTHDRSNIDDVIRAKLRGPGIFLSAFTSRPSAPPREVKHSHLGYAPEAELALELIGLADIPLIAFGKLQYISAQRGIDPAALLKPSPVQALAAIAAAWTGEEWPALQAACHWHQTGRLEGVLTGLPRAFELIVLEDTSSGIHSARAAGKILQKSGWEVTICPFGMTSGSPAKAAAFEQLNVPYFEDWGFLLQEMGL